MNIGLCADCVFMKKRAHPRGGAGYFQCIKPELPKYPTLPVETCLFHSTNKQTPFFEEKPGV